MAGVSTNKKCTLACQSFIEVSFNDQFPYNKLQFPNWPSIVAYSPAGLICIGYGLHWHCFINNTGCYCNDWFYLVTTRHLNVHVWGKYSAPHIIDKM